ncbi:a-factor receptor [Ceratobasidium sp. 395]|nr:a-factor receptor [Ceratobasidium sp. 395]
MRDPVFPVFCALGIVLCLLPLPWHWKARNTGTLLYLGWTITGCVIYFVNSLVWAGNLRNPAPVWCDISTKLMIGLSVGITASSLCINRKLYHIATIKSVVDMRSSKKRNLIIDLLLGIGLPILVMALHYIVQDHRFDILEDYGCWPATYNTLLTVPLVLIWPIIISVASFIYAGLTIRAFLETRRQFAKALSAKSTGLNTSRYFRLMALAATEMCFSLPFSLYLLIINVNSSNLNPWISFNDTHFGFSRVDVVPFIFLNAVPQTRNLIEITRWVTPGGAFLFFAYFGLAGEASEEYKKFCWKVVKPLGIKPPTPKQSRPSWSNKIVSNASSNTRDIATFPSSRPTFNATTSLGSIATDDKSETTDIKGQSSATHVHDLEGQQ